MSLSITCCTHETCSPQKLTSSKADDTGPPSLLSVGMAGAPLLSLLGLLGASGPALPCRARTVVSAVLFFFSCSLGCTTPLLGARGLALPCRARTVISVVLFFFSCSLGCSTPLSPPSTQLNFFILQHCTGIYTSYSKLYTVRVVHIMRVMKC